MNDTITPIHEPYVGLTYHNVNHPNWHPVMLNGFKFFGTRVIDGKLIDIRIKG